MKWVSELIEYYLTHARRFPWRNEKDPYAIWISEIMLQQTRTETVISYYERFLTLFPTVYDLAIATDDELYKAWEGLGYYTRARNLRKAAQVIIEKYNGVFPDDHEKILDLPGVGPYTAGAVASIAFSLPYPAVDGNVLRVYTRLYADPIDITSTKSKETVDKFLRDLIPDDKPGIFNQALMDIGATVCLPNAAPKCEVCPLSGACKAHSLHKETVFPQKTKKKARKIVSKTVFVLCTEKGYLGYMREDSGVLSGLYQLPDIEGFLSAEQSLNFLKEKGISVTGELEQYQRKHVFTHMEWDMRVFSCKVQYHTLPEKWTILSESVHAVPTAYKKCMNVNE